LRGIFLSKQGTVAMARLGEEGLEDWEERSSASPVR